ncbi:MAG: TonB-dependent receptor [Gemmatimonadota bacterium]|nr:TonB-dependent receptor [Gemmatimonadota bacterium]
MSGAAMCAAPYAAAVVGLLLSLGTVAVAQGRDSTSRVDTIARLAPVQVVGSVIPSMGPAVGSSVPARVSIVSARELAATGGRTISDALASRAGMSSYDDLGSAYKMTLVTRGFTASPVVGLPQGVSVFVDGIPVNEPDAGQVNFDLLPLAYVEQVEVLSGTASLLGPNSLGGAVNLLTRGGDGTFVTEAELTGGSYDRLGAQASTGGTTRGWRYFLGGDYDRERGWRRLTGARLANGFGRIGRSGERGGLAVQAFAARSYAETAGSLPGSVYTIRPDSNLSAGDFEDLEQLHVALMGHAALGGGRASLTAWFRRHRAERFNVNQQDDPDVRGFARNQTVGVAADWRHHQAVGSGALGLRVGAGGAANRVGIRIFGERIDPGLTTDVESPIQKVDAYTTADYQRGRLSLSGGARYDVVRVPFSNLLRPERDTVSVFARLSPRVGVSLALRADASIYASAGRSFRAPAVIELACADPGEPCPLPFALGDDPPLAPVVATTSEVGGRWARGPVVATVAAYRTDVRDDIFLFPYRDESEPAGSTIDGYFANVPRTRREGLEVGVQAVLDRSHEVYANYASTRATFQTGGVQIFSVREASGGSNEIEPGDRLPLVPNRTLSAGGTLALRHGFSVGVDAHYVGERRLRGDEANEETPLPGYATTRLRLGYDARDWEARVIVANLLDRAHATFGTFNINQGAGDVLERFLTPGEPRSIAISVRWRPAPEKGGGPSRSRARSE